MMKFTLGLAILAFTILVGSYQFIDNQNLITAKERGLKEAIAKRGKFIRIKEKAKLIPQLSMKKGDDQKNTIERLLNIGSPGLTFNFIAQRNSTNANKTTIRHDFRIQGNANFMDTLRVLRQMRSLNGFSVYRVCLGCSKKKRGASEAFTQNSHSVLIEGYLYVYDPALI